MSKAKLTELGLFSLEKKRLKKDFMNVDKNLRGEIKELDSWLLSAKLSERQEATAGTKMHEFPFKYKKKTHLT